MKREQAVPQEYLHFRLCHMCLHLNESEETINECEACQCTFTGGASWEVGSFERSEGQSGHDDDDEAPEADLRRPKRLMGLSVVW